MDNKTKQDLGAIMSDVCTWCKEISQSDDLELIAKRLGWITGVVGYTLVEIKELASDKPGDLEWIVRGLKGIKTEEDNTAKE